MPDARPVVIGGGIAGLSAALTLAEAGLRPLVIEADPAGPGGRLAARPGVAFDQNGRHWTFPGEHGIHGIWRHYRNLRALLARHGVDAALRPAQRQDWIYGRNDVVFRAEIGRRLQRTLLPAPFHYLALLGNPRFLAMLGIGGLARVPWVGITLLTMLSIDPMRDGGALAGRQVRDILFGWPPQLHDFAAALSRSGLATGPGDAPLAGFIALYRFYSLLRKDAIAHDYLAGDPETLVLSPLVRALEGLRGELALGTRATRIERSGAGWEVRWETATAGAGPAEDGDPIPAAEVVLAVDAPAAARVVAASPDLAAAGAGLVWPAGQASAVVRLWFAARPRDGSESGMFGGDFVLDNFFWLDRLQPAFAEWAAATGGSAAEAHIYGPPRLLAENDTTLLALAVRDFSRAFPELRGTRVHAHIQRNPPVHTLFSVGATAQHLGVFTPWPGLYCCGDWVRDPAPALFLERACVTGIRAANALLAARGLPQRPPLGYPPPEPLARALQPPLQALRRGMAALLNR